MTIDSVTLAHNAVDTARQNLDRARANHEAASARHAEANELREVLAGATLTNGDDDTFARLAKATDDAEAARRATDTAALIVRTAQKALTEAEAALDLERNRAAAAAIVAKANRLVQVTERIEAMGRELNTLAHEACVLDNAILNESKKHFGADFGASSGFAVQLRSAISEFGNKVSATAPYNGINGVTAAAKRVIARAEATSDLFAKTRPQDTLQ